MRQRTTQAVSWAAALASLCLAAAGPRVGAARGADPAATSPEPVPAEVIAQGTVFFPEGTFHWRAFEQQLSAGSEPSPAPEPFSIVVVTEGALAVGDGPTIPLPAGGALMIEQDPRPSMASQDGATYWTLQIYNEANSEPLNATGSPFDVEGVPHDAHLLAAVLAGGEQTTMPATGLPILVMATDGTVEVASDAGTVAELDAQLDDDRSDTFGGDLTITALSDTATVVAAVLTPPGALPSPGDGATAADPCSAAGSQQDGVVNLDIGVSAAPQEPAPGQTVTVTVKMTPEPCRRSDSAVISIQDDVDCPGIARTWTLDLAAGETREETFQFVAQSVPGGDGKCEIVAGAVSQLVRGQSTPFIVTIAASGGATAAANQVEPTDGTPTDTTIAG